MFFMSTFMDTLISMFFLNCGQTGACIQRNDIDIAVLRQEGLKDVLGIPDHLW